MPPKNDAVAIVKKGISFIKANSTKQGYAEVSNKSGQFIDRELFDLTDIDGNYFTKVRVTMA